MLKTYSLVAAAFSASLVLHGCGKSNCCSGAEDDSPELDSGSRGGGDYGGFDAGKKNGEKKKNDKNSEVDFEVHPDQQEDNVSPEFEVDQDNQGQETTPEFASMMHENEPSTDAEYVFVDANTPKDEPVDPTTRERGCCGSFSSIFSFGRSKSKSKNTSKNKKRQKVNLEPEIKKFSAGEEVKFEFQNRQARSYFLLDGETIERVQKGQYGTIVASTGVSNDQLGREQEWYQVSVGTGEVMGRTVKDVPAQDLVSAPHPTSMNELPQFSVSSEADSDDIAISTSPNGATHVEQAAEPHVEVGPDAETPRTRTRSHSFNDILIPTPGPGLGGMPRSSTAPASMHSRVESPTFSWDEDGFLSTMPKSNSSTKSEASTQFVDFKRHEEISEGLLKEKMNEWVNMYEPNNDYKKYDSDDPAKCIVFEDEHHNKFDPHEKLMLGIKEIDIGLLQDIFSTATEDVPKKSMWGLSTSTKRTSEEDPKYLKKIQAMKLVLQDYGKAMLENEWTEVKYDNKNDTDRILANLLSPTSEMGSFEDSSAGILSKLIMLHGIVQFNDIGKGVDRARLFLVEHAVNDISASMEKGYDDAWRTYDYANIPSKYEVLCTAWSDHKDEIETWKNSLQEKFQEGFVDLPVNKNRLNEKIITSQDVQIDPADYYAKRFLVKMGMNTIAPLRKLLQLREPQEDAEAAEIQEHQDEKNQFTNETVPLFPEFKDRFTEDFEQFTALVDSKYHQVQVVQFVREGEFLNESDTDDDEVVKKKVQKNDMGIILNARNGLYKIGFLTPEDTNNEILVRIQGVMHGYSTKDKDNTLLDVPADSFQHRKLVEFTETKSFDVEGHEGETIEIKKGEIGVIVGVDEQSFKIEVSNKAITKEDDTVQKVKKLGPVVLVNVPKRAVQVLSRFILTDARALGTTIGADANNHKVIIEKKRDASKKNLSSMNKECLKKVFEFLPDKVREVFPTPVDAKAGDFRVIKDTDELIALNKALKNDKQLAERKNELVVFEEQMYMNIQKYDAQDMKKKYDMKETTFNETMNHLKQAYWGRIHEEKHQALQNKDLRLLCWNACMEALEKGYESWKRKQSSESTFGRLKSSFYQKATIEKEAQKFLGQIIEADLQQAGIESTSHWIQTLTKLRTMSGKQKYN